MLLLLGITTAVIAVFITQYYNDDCLFAYYFGMRYLLY